MPSDKSIAHRALLFAALCNGKSRISRWAGGDDNESTRAALAEMGVAFEKNAIGKNDHEMIVTGAGLFGLRAPERELDCGNSGTTMRLLCGILCAQPFDATLVGDASLSSRPMMRIARPLGARGAKITGRAHQSKENEITAPLVVHALEDGAYLTAIEYALPVASAQVKSALLLSGLYAHGATTLREPTLSRDHTERMLASLGVPLKTLSSMVELDPSGWSGTMPPFEMALPGDVSAATFLLGAALLVPGSNVTARHVGTNPTRTGALDVLRMMNASIRVEPLGDENGEPIGNVTLASHATTRAYAGATIAAELVTRAIDEIPALCAIAAGANGTTTIRDAQELRVKESDRIAAMLDVLRAFGVECEPIAQDGMEIRGRAGPFRGAVVDSRGDHRIAMSAAIMALAANEPSRIRNADCITTSFPRFVGTLRALGANIEALP